MVVAFSKCSARVAVINVHSTILIAQAMF